MRLLPSLLFLAVAVSCTQPSLTPHTRGIGVYPGDPDESFAPQLVPGGNDVRNLALYRAAKHSSSYDYCLTAQLVTDGILSEGEAPWLEVLVDGEPLSKQDREIPLDGRPESRVELKGEAPVVELRFHRMPFEADRVEVVCNPPLPKEAAYAVEREDGPDATIFRIRFSNPSAGVIRLRNVRFYQGERLLDVLPSNYFHSAWKSAGAEKEWVSVDLGAVSRLDRAVFHWQNPPVSGVLQVSSDAENWKDIVRIPEGGDFGEIAFRKVRGRYLRACLDRTADGKPFELKEWEVYGRGGVSVQEKPASGQSGDRHPLSGGHWRVQRASEVQADGKSLSMPGADGQGWMVATVPGTVLSSYVNAGAVPDMKFADNQNFISESFFRSDFWYRNTFEARPDKERHYLHFDGINWKAAVWMNGTYLGMIDGAFREGEFDVTGILKDGRNDLAVKVIKNDHFGAVKEPDAYSSRLNGGVLGRDNPTMHASIGWDWIPTVRGRNAGIWDDVYLAYKGAVSVKDPFVRTELPLPDTTRATVFPEVTLVNHADRTVSGVLKGSFGDHVFSVEATLSPGESRPVRLDPFRLDHPKLWWPVGYGKQNLYAAAFSFEEGGQVSDSVSFRCGVRQMSYSIDPYTPTPGLRPGSYPDSPERLTLYVNGRRFVGFGGNWGFPEFMLNYRAREYDIAVKYHADMHFTMIRNWVGQTGDREFYEACDRYGVMVWQDFWLANPYDGPDPADPGRFNAISTEYLRRIRNHPSIALYVGRNEGNPPVEINDYLKETIAEEHPGMYYIPHSAANIVSGGGPYNALTAREYYRLFGHDKMHSERGMPNVMNYENLVRTFGEAGVEPFSSIAHPNPLYGLHNYNLGSVPGAAAAQRAESFNQIIENAFGKPANAREFADWAQWLNYEGYRAMFESRSEQRRGLLLWMSHPTWPSLVWQTYDYYLEPTAAYFGSKKACEPLHILWNPVLDSVAVVNLHAPAQSGLTAKASLLNMDGSVAWSRSCRLDILPDETRTLFPPERPDALSDVYFLQLELTDNQGNIVSDNFYWQGKEEGNLRPLRQLPQTRVKASATRRIDAEEVVFEVTVSNDSPTPALMLRVKAVDRATDDLILPVFYSDNYFFLMPGASRTMTVKVRREDCAGTPRLEISGFNVPVTQVR